MCLPTAFIKFINKPLPINNSANTFRPLSVFCFDRQCDSTVRELKKERGKRRALRKRQEAEEQRGPGGEASESQLQRRPRKRMRICFGRNTNTANICAGSEGAVARSVAAIAVDFASLAITREETEFSTSNYDNKSHAGTELTTVSSDADDVSLASNSARKLSQRPGASYYITSLSLFARPLFCD